LFNRLNEETQTNLWICDDTHKERNLKEGTVGLNGAKAPGRQKKMETKHTWRLGTRNWASVRKLMMSDTIIMTYKWHKMLGAGPIAHENCADVPKPLTPQLYATQNQNNTSSLLQYACACHGSLFAVHFNACEWQYIPTKSIHDCKQSLASDTDFEARHMISIQHVSKLDTKWMTQSSRWVCHIYRLVTYEAQRHLGGVGATKDVHASL
jgi:hypothetical protein